MPLPADSLRLPLNRSLKGNVHNVSVTLYTQK